LHIADLSFTPSGEKKIEIPFYSTLCVWHGNGRLAGENGKWKMAVLSQK